MEIKKMSKLLEAMQALDTGDRKYITPRKSKLFDNVVNIKSTIFEDKQSINVAKVYRVAATFGTQVMITDTELLSNPHALEYAADNAKRAVAEAVFGEFRPIIIQIYNALYDYDVEQARKLLSELEIQMFNVR
jgi:hypothetical protein